MIDVDRLLDLFERMEREHWAYEPGAAREGCVDCSGAFEWAYKQLGASIEHGSNSIYHLRVGQVASVAQAKSGYAVFKTRAWREEDRGNRWYGESPGDCYHIGLMGRNGKVLNAQGEKTGFVASNAKGWAFAAPLNAVKYKAEGGGKMFGNATVSVTSGYLNIREGAGTAAKIIAKAENGTRVNVIREAGGTGWVFGKLENGVAGYMAGEYLVEDESAEEKSTNAEEKTENADEATTTSLRRSDGVYVTLAGKWEIAED